MDNVPLGVPVDELASQANSYASANGVQVEKRHSDDPTKSYFECAPMSLLPNAYPKQAFAQAQTLAPHFNLLVDRVARDAEFLQKTLGGGVSDTDPYTAKLLQLYREIYVTPLDGVPNFAATADYMGIHRSDYMLHLGKSDNKYHIKQVELNTIASSFASLSTKVAALHRQKLRERSLAAIKLFREDHFAHGNNTLAFSLLHPEDTAPDVTTQSFLRNSWKS